MEGRILYDSTYIKVFKIVKLTELKNRMAVARCWGRGKGREDTYFSYAG